MFIDRSKLIVNSNDNLTILLSDQDEICDAQIINKFKIKKVKILSLENSPHFPFFDPNEIFKTIEQTS